MALSDEDVREILRIIDESSPQEVRIETEGFSLHVRKDGAGRQPSQPSQPSRPSRPSRPPPCTPSNHRCRTSGW